jgi:hypothetical protein
MAAAWKNRMNRRQGMLIGVAERIAAEGKLAPGWTASQAAAVIYVLTMPGPWRELTHEFGWSEDQYAERIWRVLESALLGGNSATG